VTVAILSLDPGDGGAPGEGEVEFAARVLKEELRNFDTITRYSRRELAFILPDLGGDEALKVMERVLGAITSERPQDLPAIHVGFSSYPENATTVERLIETAEAAVNLARDKGPSSISRWKE
jgi:diguanylate cyclase (GGDEF)-like protein